MCNPIDSAQTRDCVELICTTMSPIYLNTSALSDLYLLILFLSSSLVYKLDHIQQVLFYALVNFRSTYYFSNSSFVYTYNLLISSVNFTYLMNYQITLSWKFYYLSVFLLVKVWFRTLMLSYLILPALWFLDTISSSYTIH